MNQESRQGQQLDSGVPTRKFRPAPRIAVGMLVVTGALFGSAGKVDWAVGWLYLLKTGPCHANWQGIGTTPNECGSVSCRASGEVAGSP